MGNLSDLRGLQLSPGYAAAELKGTNAAQQIAQLRARILNSGNQDDPEASDAERAQITGVETWDPMVEYGALTMPEAVAAVRAGAGAGGADDQ
jgi:hypothetical protein